ncbi:unnamed protein product [Hyaloperonospora brassicae]|uniref:PX domain-containing protein n=1 Tax=Hyaloperonospora brassicae TaxID=162125 RepID=A0AAV0TVI3_HYABA|nr:unnamed protein product [Hyaloperonospora brassicae]
MSVRPIDTVAEVESSEETELEMEEREDSEEDVGTTDGRVVDRRADEAAAGLATGQWDDIEATSDAVSVSETLEMTRDTTSATAGATATAVVGGDDVCVDELVGGVLKQVGAVEGAADQSPGDEGQEVVGTELEEEAASVAADDSVATPATDANVTALAAVSECEEGEDESVQFSNEFEVDTRPISAVSMLISRFESLARRNAEDAVSARTYSVRDARDFDVSVLPTPPSTWSRRSALWTAAKAKAHSTQSQLEDTAKESPETEMEDADAALDEAVASEKTLEDAPAEAVAAEVLATTETEDADVALDEAVASEETLEDAPAEAVAAEAPVTTDTEDARTMNETDECAQEDSVIATADADGGTSAQVFVPEASSSETVVKEWTVEAEDVVDTADAIEEPPVALGESVVPELIEDSTDVVKQTCAAQDDKTGTATTSKVKTVRFTDSTNPGEADATDAGATEADEAVEETSTVVDITDEVAEDGVEECMTEEVTSYDEATDASSLPVNGLEADAVAHGPAQAFHGVDEDAVPAVVLLIERIEAAVADADASSPMKKRVEEPSSDSAASVVKEMPSVFEETGKEEVLCVDNEAEHSTADGDCVKDKSNLIERRTPEVVREAPSVQAKDSAVASEATAKVLVGAAGASHLTRSVADDMTIVETTPERNSSQTSAYDHLTYEILGVTRANKVMMYHIYAIHRVTGERVTSVPKRYSDFKLLDEQLRAMDLPSACGLPELPTPTVRSFLRGRRSKKTIEIRERAFGGFLHYVQEHADLHESVAFQQFIAAN